jgi:NitT/TauT family transport system ATP-binding protein
LVFQEYSIYPWKTVLDNVRLGLDIARLPRKEANRVGEEWIERLGLAGFERQYPHALSGGMKQRVAIARALAVGPEILLMDEPFAALDPQLRLIMQEELLRLWESDRRTVMFVTHSLDEALMLSDRVIVMSARPGRVIGDFIMPFPRPRSADLRATPEFASMSGEIWSLLKSEVTEAIASGGK